MTCGCCVLMGATCPGVCASSPSVLSTPSMIMLMELVSHSAVADELPPGYTTVGYEVHVRHVMPAPAGATVTVATSLAEVEGNKLLFEVSCRQGEVLIGEGTHRRAIVRVPQPCGAGPATVGKCRS